MQRAAALANPAVDLVALEKDKVKGAVRTDFILSAEIIAITLGTVQGASFITQLGVLVGIAIVMTVGVYGLVAGIVKLDDGGLYLSKREGPGVASVLRAIGHGILWLAPWLMKALSIAGTAAMFLVGGGILTHGVPAVSHWIDQLTAGMAASGGGLLASLTGPLVNAVVGIVAGAVVLLVVSGVKKLLPKRKARTATSA